MVIPLTFSRDPGRRRAEGRGVPPQPPPRTDWGGFVHMQGCSTSTFTTRDAQMIHVHDTSNAAWTHCAGYLQHLLTPPPPAPPGNGQAHPSSGVWTWTEAHVRDPFLLTQGRRGHTYRLTVGCGSLHEAVGTGTRPPTYRTRGGSACPGPHTEHTTRKTRKHWDSRGTTWRRDTDRSFPFPSQVRMQSGTRHISLVESSKKHAISYPCPSHPPTPV